MNSTFLAAKVKRLKQTGILNFVGDITFNDDTLKKETLSKYFSLIKDLNISHTEISTLEGLKPMPSIRYFTANNTRIRTFKNFLCIKTCSAISLKNTPIYSKKHFKLILVILFGDSLISINGLQVPDSLRQIAKKYDPIYSKLINAGWEFEKKPLSQKQLENLCKQYKIDFKQSIIRETKSFSDSETSEEETESEVAIPELIDEEEDNTELNRTVQEFDDFLQQIRDEQRDPTLAEKLETVLQKHNVAFMKGNKYQILREIKIALDTVKILFTE